MQSVLHQIELPSGRKKNIISQNSLLKSNYIGGKVLIITSKCKIIQVITYNNGLHM